MRLLMHESQSDAIGDAGNDAMKQMQQFSSVFAPVPSIEKQVIFMCVPLPLGHPDRPDSRNP